MPVGLHASSTGRKEHAWECVCGCERCLPHAQACIAQCLPHFRPVLTPPPLGVVSLAQCSPHHRPVLTSPSLVCGCEWVLASIGQSFRCGSQPASPNMSTTDQPCDAAVLR
eukprot:11690120-Alexandrium_andersonii.AAC.1